MDQNSKTEKQELAPKLKLFSDKSFLNNKVPYADIFYPFWGVPSITIDPLDDSRRFENYIADGQNYFELTAAEEADLIVMPSNWESDPAIQKDLIQFANQYDPSYKKLVAFFWEDTFEALPFEGATIFRTSFLASQRSPREFSIPVWSEDFVQEYLKGKLSIRSKQAKAKVGFCGFAEPLNPSFRFKIQKHLRRLKALIKQQRGNKAAGIYGRELRSKAMKSLIKHEKIETDFIINTQFWAGMLDKGDEPNLDLMKQARSKYLNNMINSDYTLCIRGAGNFSFRLYETLSCGRIPIILDTDLVLPYDFCVDWRQHGVWVPIDQLDQIGDIVAKFHDSLSEDAFQALQIRNRAFWEEWLSPHGFFKNFYRHFE